MYRFQVIAVKSRLRSCVTWLPRSPSLAGVLGEVSAVGIEVPVLGFGMEDLNVPLHRVRIWSELLTGDVTPAFPVFRGLHF